MVELRPKMLAPCTLEQLLQIAGVAAPAAGRLVGWHDTGPVHMHNAAAPARLLKSWLDSSTSMQAMYPVKPLAHKRFNELGRPPPPPGPHDGADACTCARSSSSSCPFLCVHHLLISASTSVQYVMRSGCSPDDTILSNTA